jgi:hypothetical protein
MSDGLNMLAQVNGQTDSETDGGLLEFIPAEYHKLVIWGIVILIALLVLRVIWRGIRGAFRRRRPATIHPKLQKYNVDYEELNRQREEQATVIIATSTGNRLAGYRVKRQVEAVFVDGCRSPEEAMLALKAAAAERGANAILNVRTERTTAGKCSASGDAVVVAPPLQPPKRPSAPPSD